jgi:hypothetical protein
VETFSTGRERDGNESNTTIRGGPGRDRHHRGRPARRHRPDGRERQRGRVLGPRRPAAHDQHERVHRGPWDTGTLDLGNQAVLFVTNVLNGTVAANGRTVFGGTVLRLVIQIPPYGLPYIWSNTTIGSGFPEALNSSALVIGPAGVALGPDGVVYVADTLANRIGGIPDALIRGGSAGRGFTVSQAGKLLGQLRLVIAPNGNILTVNGGNGNLVEVTPSGAQIAVRTLDTSGGPPPGAGALFGLAARPGHHRGVHYVDDATNTLNLLH